jgi:chorismate dehydratase
MSKVKSHSSNRVRIGHIQFLNCLPLYYGLVENRVLGDVELIKGTPTELNRLLIERKLDISPISSIAYAHHRQELLLMPNLSVSCDGAVKSIYLVSKVPIEELDGRTVALASTSATSQVLLKIILADGYHVRSRFHETIPDLGLMLSEADAALLIGDAALHVHYKRPGGLYTYDLGEEWQKITCRKMVFAVWAVHRSFAAVCPDTVREVYQAFEKSMTYSLHHVAQIASEAANQEVFSANFLQNYFTTLEFGFDAGHRQGLLEYYRRARDLGYLTTVPTLEFLEV